MSGAPITARNCTGTFDESMPCSVGGADVGEGVQTLVADDRDHLELTGLHLFGDVRGAARA